MSASTSTSKSTYNTKITQNTVKFAGFGGINTLPKQGEQSSAADTVNFKVMHDGSLMKRSGFAPIATCSSEIRAIWSGDLDGEEVTFILYGFYIARVDVATKSLVPLGEVNTSSGSAIFTFFDSRLILIDASSFYHVTRDGISEIDGYAPLYGVNWPTAATGEVKERLNLASRHIRMTYRTTESMIYLRTEHKISSIDAVFVNGVDVTHTREYYIDPQIDCVCVIGLKYGDYVELYLTLDESEIKRDNLLSCKQSAVFGGYTNNRLFLWAGDDPKIMYGSLPVSDEDLAAVKKVYPNALPLYISEDAAFVMGKEGRRITAACPQLDRMLIFTDSETWMAKSPDESAPELNAITVNHSRGCTSLGGALMCENDPVCISRGTILKWLSNSDELNERNAYSISSEIDSMIGFESSFYKNAIIFHDRRSGELLFSDPSDAQGRLWIYDYQNKNWYKYDGIGAKFLFTSGGELGFVKDRTVYLFNDDLTYDLLVGGVRRPIRAVYETQPIDFKKTSNKKRLRKSLICATLDGAELCAEYVSEGEIIASLNFSDNEPHPKTSVKKLNSKRFSFVTLRLVTDSDAPVRIYSGEIMARG